MSDQQEQEPSTTRPIETEKEEKPPAKKSTKTEPLSSRRGIAPLSVDPRSASADTQVPLVTPATATASSTAQEYFPGTAVQGETMAASASLAARRGVQQLGVDPAASSEQIALVTPAQAAAFAQARGQLLPSQPYFVPNPQLWQQQQQQQQLLLNQVFSYHQQQQLSQNDGPPSPFQPPVALQPRRQPQPFFSPKPNEPLLSPKPREDLHPSNVAQSPQVAAAAQDTEQPEKEDPEATTEKASELLTEKANSTPRQVHSRKRRREMPDLGEFFTEPLALQQQHIPLHPLMLPERLRPESNEPGRLASLKKESPKKKRKAKK